MMAAASPSRYMATTAGGTPPTTPPPPPPPETRRNLFTLPIKLHSCGTTHDIRHSFWLFFAVLFSMLSYSHVVCLSISAAVRKPDVVARQKLSEFGIYAADCLPKYVQKVQITSGDELELLIAPEGVIPVISFLKDHHTCQFTNLIDIAGMDVPARTYRFEVTLIFDYQP